jgi:hypothetical protein
VAVEPLVGLETLALKVLVLVVVVVMVLSMLDIGFKEIAHAY